MVKVLGEIGEMREIAVRPHHDHRLVGGEAVERALEFVAGRGVVVAVERDRAAADALDDLEGLSALLVPHGVAEQAPEQADVLLERQVLVIGFVLARLLLGGIAARPRRRDSRSIIRGKGAGAPGLRHVATATTGPMSLD